MAKKINDPTAEKRSFWQRLVGMVEETPDLAAEQTIDEPVAMRQEAEQPALQVVQQPEAAAATPQEADIVLRARQLADEEIEKQRIAAAAVAEASRAEAAHRRAKEEVALSFAEQKAYDLQLKSARAQTAASAALDQLNEAEAVFAEALKAQEAAELAEATLRAQYEEELQALMLANEEKLAGVRSEIAAFEQVVEDRRSQAELALKEGQEAEAQLEEVEAELRRVNTEGTDDIRLAIRDAEAIKAEIGLLEKQIEVLDGKIHAEQEAFDQTAQHIAEMADQLREANENLAVIRSEEQKAQKETDDDAAMLMAAINEQSDKIEQDLLRLQEQLDTHVAAAEQASAAAEEAKLKEREAEEALQALRMQREDMERAVKRRSAEVVSTIDAAKAEVVARKEEYSAAQRHVEEMTANLVKANATAKSARERVERTKLEVKDAKVAAEMAAKLKSDATIAKSSDEASSQLLEKAELVLISTIDRANKLLQEKEHELQGYEAEVLRREEEVAEATAASSRATEQANTKISVWLSAEEELVRTTAYVEAEKARIEAELQMQLEVLDHQISVAEDLALEKKDQASQCVAAASAAEADRDASATALADMEDQLKELRRAAEVETTRQRANSETRLVRIQNELAQAEARYEVLLAEHESLSAEHEKATEPFYQQLSELRQEREGLSEELRQKQAVAVECEQATVEKEVAYKNTLSELRSYTEALQQKIKDCRATAVAEAEAIEEAKLKHAKASRDLEECEEEVARAEAEARNRMNAALVPKEQQNAAEKEKLQVLTLAMNQKRNLASHAVKEAAEIFSQRLVAVNAVTVKKVETEISNLKASAVQLYQDEENEKRKLEAAEAAYAEISQQANELRAEEVRITYEFEVKYRSIETEKNVVLERLQQELESLLTQEGDKHTETEFTATLLQSLKEKQFELTAAHKEALAAHEAIVAANAEQLAQIDSQQAEQLAALSGNLPQLLAELEAINAEVDLIAAEIDQRSAAYQAQVGEVERLLEIEKAAPALAEEQVSVVKEKYAARLEQTKRRLNELEEKEAELRATYQKSCDYAERSEQARKDVEDYLSGLKTEAASNRQEMDAELSALQAHLAALREDQEAKEQTYREAEKTLSNSTELIEEAEQAFQAAKIATAKTLSELQSAQAAKETATSLAQQASQAFISVDQSTADIMQRAAEGLFSAAENAAVLVAEKEQAHLASEAELSRAEAALRSVQQAIGEAPALLEESRQIWQAAVQAYQSYKVESEEKTAAIRSRYQAFTLQRQGDLAAAEERVVQCRQEAGASAATVEQQSRQLMDIAAEISKAAIVMQTLEVEATNAIADVESAVAAEAEAKRTARADADALAAEQATRLGELQKTHDAALQKQALCAARYDEHKARYEAEQAALTAKLEESKSALLLQQQEASEALSAASVALQEVELTLENATLQYEELVDTLSTIRSQRIAKESEREQVLQLKEKMLQAVEEEKLRLIGMKTIARIAAEEKTSLVKDDCTIKRAHFEAAANRVHEIELALERAGEKLQQINQESEKAIASAKQQAAVITHSNIGPGRQEEN